jgi:hypothetical protein
MEFRELKEFTDIIENIAAVWMLTAYLKSEKADLTQNEIRDIAKIIKEIKGGLL